MDESETDAPGVYDNPEGEQQDSAQPLDHMELDDAVSEGKKVSEQQDDDASAGDGSSDGLSGTR